MIYRSKLNENDPLFSEKYAEEKLQLIAKKKTLGQSRYSKHVDNPENKFCHWYEKQFPSQDICLQYQIHEEYAKSDYEESESETSEADEE